MNERQRRFADEYIKTGNATQAAIAAGYTEKYANTNASKLLQNTTIKIYIDEQMAELHKKNIMDAEEALSILSDIARGKRDEEVLLMNPLSGVVERHTKKADNATVIKAVTEILKRYPTAKQSEKLELELAKLKEQLNVDNDGDGEIIIVDDQADELEGLIDDL
ncbi:terminase small subunit [Streptococcus sp. HF-1907]|uniref:terminase small subunit n=1 Tax=Streptococcus sp. HF-1907 TaxID=2785793 RepID=UPI00189F46E7|nr:terminase small subunit [Streptococcus sp. HF-1907]MBF7094267.1 terminase small subunit [Streptococcus sp. HF-1907]